MERELTSFEQNFELRAARFKRVNQTVLDDDNRQLVAGIKNFLNPLNPPRFSRLFNQPNCSNDPVLPTLLAGQDAESD